MLSFWLLLSRGDTLQATRRQRPQHEAWPRTGGRNEKEDQDQDEDVDDGTGNCFSMQIHIISRQSVPTTTAIVVDTPTPPPLRQMKLFFPFAFPLLFKKTSPIDALLFFIFYHFVFMFHIFYVCVLFYLLRCAQTFASDCYRHSSKRFDECC